MFKYIKFVEILICLQALIISTMIPVVITIPYSLRNIKVIDLPITWQIPLIIFLSLIYQRGIVLKAFTIYLFIGLFFLPIFYQGGSLGYLLTPNFGYLIGIYPLITIIGNLKNKNIKLNIITLIKTGIFGICIMHLIGIMYGCIQILYAKDFNILLYNISKYSLGKIGYHILMLFPITLIIRQINHLKNRNL